jgi:hypothetical protein
VSDLSQYIYKWLRGLEKVAWSLQGICQAMVGITPPQTCASSRQTPTNLSDNNVPGGVLYRPRPFDGSHPTSSWYKPLQLLKGWQKWMMRRLYLIRFNGKVNPEKHIHILADSISGYEVISRLQISCCSYRLAKYCSLFRNQWYSSKNSIGVRAFRWCPSS